ncbi:hypothetical protein [Mycolicibacterium llatzerense]|jgi:hypothetical protein|uniref:hypothetical protein n=1 Tax=Mycolicibacterium llatzerense TaxID=280871 RepID=UPI00105B9218|nr:hypothetical protein [Mycolicibacterium llatzerense]MCT7364707.1 hypothetical protein [Mycolicibacterium llatzerense]
MTGMRKATVKLGVVCGAAAVAAAGLMAPVASAAPAGHEVRYTLSVGGPATFDLLYLVNQPANKAAYNADAYSYLKRETVTVGPDAPWVFTTTLADPQWAIFTVSSTTHGGQAAPDSTCDIAVDGQSAAHQTAPYNVQCQLGQW